ncbi:MAG: aspartate-semialdehyde dehydrogenase [Actinomycetota bacterium]
MAILGASGVVGREMMRTLERRSFPVDELIPLASARSEGTKVIFNGGEVTVRAVSEQGFDGVDVALFSPGAMVSREWAPKAVDAGAVVVDNSSAFRMDPDVPLVVPEINGDDIARHKGIVANPNCTAITALMSVAPLHKLGGLERLVVSSYQSVSGMGSRGIAELIEQVEKLSGREQDLLAPDPESLPSGEIFGKTIAYNVLPRGGSFDPDGWTTEETKLVEETRKILSLPQLPVAATVVRVPVFTGHSVSILAELSREVSPDEARAALASTPGVKVVDDPHTDTFPTPLEAAGRDEVLVGRIRQGDRPDTLLLFASGDNLRKGAALNAVQIAERLSAKG